VLGRNALGEPGDCNDARLLHMARAKTKVKEYAANRGGGLLAECKEHQTDAYTVSDVSRLRPPIGFGLSALIPPPS